MIGAKAEKEKLKIGQKIPSKNIRELIEKGKWKEIGPSEGCRILKRGNELMAINPKDNEIEAIWTLEPKTHTAALLEGVKNPKREP